MKHFEQEDINLYFKDPKSRKIADYTLHSETADNGSLTFILKNNSKKCSTYEEKLMENIMNTMVYVFSQYCRYIAANNYSLYIGSKQFRVIDKENFLEEILRT